VASEPRERELGRANGRWDAEVVGEVEGGGECEMTWTLSSCSTVTGTLFPSSVHNAVIPRFLAITPVRWVYGVHGASGADGPAVAGGRVAASAVVAGSDEVANVLRVWRVGMVGAALTGNDGMHREESMRGLKHEDAVRDATRAVETMRWAVIGGEGGGALLAEYGWMATVALALG